VNRGLILQLAKRDLLGRYRGSFLGLTWSILQPLFMLMIYTFVFSVIFKAHWVAGEQLPTSGFALVLFAGLTTFTLFAECVNRSPALIVNHPNYVKKVVFPLEVLPWVTAGSAAFHAHSPDLRSACLMDMDFAVPCLLVPRSRLTSGFSSSTRAFAPRFLQTPIAG